jgi:tetratricopeptide (TPR) repeat protein
MKKAVSIKADSWVVSLCQGILCSQPKQFAEAMPYFETAIEKAPTCADPYVLRAGNYVDWKKPDKAIEDYTQALAIKTDDAMALALRGSAYQQLAQGKNAVEDFTKVIGLFDAKAGRYSDRPNYLGTAYLQRGSAYVSLNDGSHALPDLEMASTLLKGESAGFAYIAAGLLKKANGDYPGAMRAFTAASGLVLQTKNTVNIVRTNQRRKRESGGPNRYGGALCGDLGSGLESLYHRGWSERNGVNERWASDPASDPKI